MSNVKNYLSLIKFSHTIFAMPFAFIGFFFALKTESIEFSIQKLILVILCMVFARSAAMAFNRYIDRNIDKKNARTAVREIPSGKVSEKNALLFIIFNCLALINCTLFINEVCFYLSPIALLVVLGYSYTKRFTALCHLILGLGLSLAPIGSYIAVTNHFSLIPLLFSVVVLFWVSGFDIIYSLQDEEFDSQQNLNSIPVLVGKKGALLVSRISHVASILVLVLIGFKAELHTAYWIGVAFFMGMIIFQHTQVKHNDLSKVNLAFFTANGIASIVFATCTIIDFLFF